MRRYLAALSSLFLAACGDSTPTIDASPITPQPTTTIVHIANGATRPTAAYPGLLPTFEQRYVGDAGALEPDLDFTSNGDALYFAWTYGGLVNDQKFNVVSRSSDRGATWQDVTPTLLQGPSAVGDPILYRDAISGRVFATGHNNYMPISFSDDGGDSWTSPPPVIAGGVTDYPVLWSVPADDLPLATFPSQLLLCVFTTISYECHATRDGGLTWPLITSPFPERTSFTINCVPNTGRVAGSTSDSTLYVPFVLAANADSPTGYIACANPNAPIPQWGQWVGVSRDHGLSWELHHVADLGGYGDLRIATDGAGNAYLLMIGEDNKPYLSVSKDRGATWSAPIDVAAPGVTAVNQISLAAGDAGRIAFFYIGTSIPGGAEISEDPASNAEWFAYESISLNAADDAPVFATTIVGDAVRRGPCLGRCLIEDDVCIVTCSVGGPTKGMRDYTNTKVNPVEGMIWTAFVDLCEGDCADPSFRGAVAIQTGGTPILSTSLQ